MNKEVRRKGLGGSFGEISAIDLVEQTVIQSRRRPPTESQMDLVQVTQQLDKCLSYRLQSDDRPTGRILTKRRTLPDVLRMLFAKRVRYSLQLLKQFVVYSESELSLDVTQRRIEEDLSEGVTDLQSVLASHQQKLKVYAFIRIKMLAGANDYTFTQHSFIDREYLMLKLQALAASTQKIFENLRKKVLREFFVEIQKHAQEQLRKERERKVTRQREFHSETLRKTSKSATVISTTDNQAKQIIYIVQNDRGRSRQKTEVDNHPTTPTSKRNAFIRVPLYTEQVELNEIRLSHDYSQKPSRFNASTAHKQQRRRMVEYDARELVQHGRAGGGCTECRFCRQQEQLKAIQRTSEQRRKSLTIKSQFSKNRRLVHLN